jgi:pimeloyl-ACP methyl ester carboxylesterase
MTPGDWPIPIDAPLVWLPTTSGQVATYRHQQVQATRPPLLLVHSVNAAASAAEVRPLFEQAATVRTVWAIDLPGFGRSDRPAMAYTPQTMTEAILAVLEAMRRETGSPLVDVLAVSLSAEFAARAALVPAARVRRLALVSPTGLSARSGRHGPPGTTRIIPWLDRSLRHPVWGERLFRLLTRPAVIRYFLRRTFGRRDIDETLWRHAVATAQQPGARHAPLRFVAGALFSADAIDLYRALHMPVWVSMPTRGDFTDYEGRGELVRRANWQFHRFEGGALPYFEDPVGFAAALEGFWG